MRKNNVVLIFSTMMLLAGCAWSQQFDASFGAGTVVASPSRSTATTYYQDIGGGTFLGFNADAVFWHNLGINVGVNWRATQAAFEGSLPYRPVFYDFNVIYVKDFTRKVSLEALAGIGALDARFYQPYANCTYFYCTNYNSVQHFMGDFGGGVRFYMRPNIFIRPEARVYLINNNIVSQSQGLSFSGPWAASIGGSIGFTVGSRRERY